MSNHNLRVYDSMLGLLSNADNPTPLVKLNRVVPFQHAAVYAKLEWYNPFGAIKDRVAANLITDAEERGTIGEIRKLVEPTSGNTGMGLAMMSNAKGYSLTTTLSAEIPAEKKSVLRFFGCDVIELDDDLCPAPGAPEGAMALAADMASKPNFHQLNQYVNPANPDAHFKTTGPEIWRQTQGNVTHFVAGLGTCGTITGTGRFLKSQNSSVKVLGVHPSEGHDIPGVRSLRQLQLTDFFLPDEYDGMLEVGNEEAFELTRRLNQEESIVAGPSSGMALAGALKLVPDEPGIVAVVIFPDNIFKYATSVQKHLPELFPGASNGASEIGGTAGKVLGNVVEFARRSSDAIDCGEVEDLLDEADPVIIDVRSPAQYGEERAENAINIPLDELSADSPGLPEDKEHTIIAVCAVGKNSLYAMLLLKSLGYRNVKSVQGGMQSWQAEGLPMEY